MSDHQKQRECIVRLALLSQCMKDDIDDLKDTNMWSGEIKTSAKRLLHATNRKFNKTVQDLNEFDSDAVAAVWNSYETIVKFISSMDYKQMVEYADEIKTRFSDVEGVGEDSGREQGES
jgi:hypothetical protein